MREAVFSSLGARVVGARVLDLYAGSGAYGLEAWSRGAVSVVAVERDRRALAALRENGTAVARSLGAAREDFLVCEADVERWRPEGRFDLVFADPPYPEMRRAARRIAELGQAVLADSDEARLILEMPGEDEPELAGFALERRLGKGRGQPTAAVFRRA